MSSRWSAPLVLVVAAFTGCARFDPYPPAIPHGGRAVAVAVSPTADSQIIVASESGGLFRTQDGGNKWVQVTRDATFWFTDVRYHPSIAGLVIATGQADFRTVSNGGMWRSTDGGTTWIRPPVTAPTAACTNDLGASSVDVDPASNRIWAGTTCGLAYSDDAGQTWTWLPKSTGYDQEPILAVVARGGDLKILSSSDGRGIDGERHLSVVKVSTDGGKTFLTSSKGLPPWPLWAAYHAQLAVSPLDHRHIYFTFNYWETTPTGPVAHDALYLSPDNGASWTRISDSGAFNRPTFVRLAKPLAGTANTYDLYYSDGAYWLAHAVVTHGATPSAAGWTRLDFDHGDPSDLAFRTDGKTPLLLTTDGGLHRTADDGGKWTFIEPQGKTGYNALQITDVTGQRHEDGSFDLYFATQDNEVWAFPVLSPDKRPPNYCCGEGYGINVWRDALPQGQTKVSLGRFGNFIADPILAGLQQFPNAPGYAGAPRLLAPGAYLQATRTLGSTETVFNLSVDTGATWSPRFKIPAGAMLDLPVLAGSKTDPVVFIAAQRPGTTPDKLPNIGIKRITGTLGGGTPVVSDVGGAWSLGAYYMSANNYYPFGVNPHDPNHIIVPDIIGNVVRVTHDGGASWADDTNLTRLVTEAGALRFRVDQGPQIRVFGYDPDLKGHILVGTRQAGVLRTWDNGATWRKLNGTDVVGDITSFHFSSSGLVFVSTYGSGLWTLSDPPPSNRTRTTPAPPAPRAPMLHTGGAMFPLSDLADPEGCPRCGFFLVEKGEIIDLDVDASTRIVRSLSISDGALRGFDPRGEALPLSIPSKKGAGRSSRADPQATEILSRWPKLRVKGVYLEGDRLVGTVLATDDVSPDWLPRRKPLAPHIMIAPASRSDGARIPPDERLEITGVGFDRNAPLVFFLDGRPIALQPTFDAAGRFRATLQHPHQLGGHRLLVEQTPGAAVTRDVVSYHVAFAEPKHEARQAPRRRAP